MARFRFALQRVLDRRDFLSRHRLHLGIGEHFVQRGQFAAQPDDLARCGSDGLQLGKLFRRRDKIGGRHIAGRHAGLQRGMAFDDGVDLLFGN